MEFVNHLYKVEHTTEDIIVLARLLKPFAPHLASEMLEKLNTDHTWPQWNEKLLTADTVEIVVQVNGKLRARVHVDQTTATDAKTLESTIRQDPKVQQAITDKTISKTIVLPRNHLVNFVTK